MDAAFQRAIITIGVSIMDAKQAVAAAKQHIDDLFGAEGVFNVGLEEIEYDDAREQWHITIGFSRPWDKKPGVLAEWTASGRTYKVVIIDHDGKVLSVKNRETANAG
jgi:hypothetical protein